MKIKSPKYPHRGGCDGDLDDETIEFPDTEVIPETPTVQPIPVEPEEEPILVPDWPVKVPDEVKA